MDSGSVTTAAQVILTGRTGFRAAEPSVPAEAKHASERPAPTEPPPDELRQLEQLRARDREVRAHEQAHRAAGGRYASAASFETVRGPDGRSYAVGGEVQIELGPESDPQDTLRKMETVIAAALAPAQPSAQDRLVAAVAAQRANEARAELQRRSDDEAAAPGASTAEDGAAPDEEDNPRQTLAAPDHRGAQAHADVQRMGAEARPRIGATLDVSS